MVAAPPSREASRLLAEAAIARGLDAFDEPGVLANQTARIAFVRGLRRRRRSARRSTRRRCARW